MFKTSVGNRRTFARLTVVLFVLFSFSISGKAQQTSTTPAASDADPFKAVAVALDRSVSRRARRRRSRASLRSRRFITSARPAAAFGRRLMAASTGSRSPTAQFSAPARSARSALSESDPNTIYVGMGESPIRGNVSHGDGVYKSTDAGKTWKRVGLEDTRQIGRVRVHPKNPDIVYVAAIGHVLGAERTARRFSLEGRRQDLGKNSLSRQQSRRDRSDPRSDESEYDLRGLLGGLSQALDAGERRRRAAASSNRLTAATPGPRFTRNPGLADEAWSARSASPFRPRIRNASGRSSKPKTAACFVRTTAAKPGRRSTKSGDLRQRAWYYTRIYADPKNADTVYVLNTGFYKSNDGGRTFTGDRRAARRQSRSLDRARRSEPHDRKQRRRRECFVQRRPKLDRTGSADRAVLSRRARQRFSLQHLRRAAGQLDRAHRQPHDRRRHHANATGTTSAAASRAGLRPRRKIRTSSLPALTADC